MSTVQTFFSTQFTAPESVLDTSGHVRVWVSFANDTFQMSSCVCKSTMLTMLLFVVQVVQCDFADCSAEGRLCFETYVVKLSTTMHKLTTSALLLVTCQADAPCEDRPCATIQLD